MFPYHYVKVQYERPQGLSAGCFALLFRSCKILHNAAATQVFLLCPWSVSVRIARHHMVKCCVMGTSGCCDSMLQEQSVRMCPVWGHKLDYLGRHPGH